MAISRSVVRSAILGGGADVTERNSSDVIYIKDDESTDGAIRVIPDIRLGTEVEFQLRANGVWNDTGIVIAGSTIYLGRELKLSGAGEWLLTRDESENLKAAVPHMRLDRMDENNGTETYPTVPVLGVKNIQEVISTGSVDTSDTDHEISWTATFSGLQDAFYVFIGATAPSADVTVEFWRDVRDVTGNLFFTRNYPASDFASSSVVRIEEGEIVEVNQGDTVIIILKSSVAFDMRENFGDFYYALDYWPISFETGVTLETGIGNLLSDNSGNMIVDDAGDMVYSGSPQN